MPAKRKVKMGQNTLFICSIPFIWVINIHGSRRGIMKKRDCEMSLSRDLDDLEGQLAGRYLDLSCVANFFPEQAFGDGR